MMFLVGKRVARTDRFTDTSHICYRCKALDREVSFYQSYFHFCFIPCFPAGKKTVEMRCRSCGDDTRLESVVAEFENRARPAVYLWSGTAFFILITTVWFFWHSRQQSQTAAFLINPAIGDVYTIEENTKDGSEYHFLRVAGVKKDSISMLSNKVEYGGFVSNLADDDYFVAGDSIVFSLNKLKAMREDEEITRIQRGFKENSSFARVK